MESLSVLEQGPRFLIADDHAMFAEAPRLYLEKAHPVVGIALHTSNPGSCPSFRRWHIPARALSRTMKRRQKDGNLFAVEASKVCLRGRHHPGLAEP